MDKHYYQEAMIAALAAVLGRNAGLSELTAALNAFYEEMQKKETPSASGRPKKEKGE